MAAAAAEAAAAAATWKTLYNRSKPTAVLFDTERTGEREKRDRIYTVSFSDQVPADARRHRTFLSGSDLE